MGESVAMMLLMAGIAGLAGFTWLALAMDVHWQQVQGGAGPAPSKRTLRLFGVAGLAVSAVFCFLADRPSMAVLVWVMLMASTALLVAMTLSWRPQILRLLWPAGRR